MSDAASALPGAGAPPRPLLLGVETIRRTVLWLMVFGGSIVMIQPSPYEVFGVLAMLVWTVTGLRYSREMVPITLLLLVYMTGASVTLTEVMDKPGTAMWTAIGWYMALTALFFMMLAAEDTRRRMDLIVRAFIASAVVASLIGVAAYARLLPGSDLFLLYGRAKSTFGDPNVFGPFLVYPAVFLIQKLYLDGPKRSLGTILCLIAIMAGLFWDLAEEGPAVMKERA